VVASHGVQGDPHYDSPRRQVLHFEAGRNAPSLVVRAVS
jgi:hypothetical protein